MAPKARPPIRHSPRVTCSGERELRRDGVREARGETELRNVAGTVTGKLGRLCREVTC